MGSDAENMMNAARTLVKERLEKGPLRSFILQTLLPRPSLRGRMQRLAGQPDASAVGHIIGDVGAWAAELTLARNAVAHVGGANNSNLFDLQRTTRNLIALVLMQELGLPGAVQERAASSAMARW